MDTLKTTSDVQGFRVGDVVNTFEGAFNSAVILGFERVGDDLWFARLARPYCYAHDYGTPRADALCGVEEYSAPVSGLRHDEASAKGDPPRFAIAERCVVETRAKVA